MEADKAVLSKLLTRHVSPPPLDFQHCAISLQPNSCIALLVSFTARCLSWYVARLQQIHPCWFATKMRHRVCQAGRDSPLSKAETATRPFNLVTCLDILKGRSERTRSLMEEHKEIPWLEQESLHLDPPPRPQSAKQRISECQPPDQSHSVIGLLGSLALSDSSNRTHVCIKQITPWSLILKGISACQRRNSMRCPRGT